MKDFLKESSWSVEVVHFLLFSPVLLVSTLRFMTAYVTLGLYVLRSGCPWRLLPHEFPAWGTVYYSFRRWEREAVWKQVLQSLRMEVRQKQGRNAEPSAAVIDSQSIKTSAVRGPEKGYDAGKKNLGTQTASLG